MGAVFTKLLNMSIAASWLIVAVIILRLVLKKAPKWINCLLWGLVAIRLVCPVSFESTFSLVPSAETINSGMIRTFTEPVEDSKTPVAVRPIDLGTDGTPDLDTDGNLMANAETGAVSLWRNVVSTVWIIGFIGLWGYALIRYLLLLRTVSEAIPLHRSVAETAPLSGSVGEAVFLNGSVSEAVSLRENVWIGDRIRSPFLSGIIRPRIYLSSSTEESQIGYILAHEQAHLKRKDHWWKLIGFVLLTVYWFNPLSWAAYILLCRDIELACDEKVIRQLGEEEKRLYSKALLSCSTQRRMVLACPPAFGEVGVKQRVKSVLNYKKPAFWAVSTSVLVCLIVAVCFLTTSPKTWQIKVTIRADEAGYFTYSDEEISPKGNTLTLYAGEGMGDGEIRLLPVEVSQENAYDETFYITPGMPVKMDVEKGAWYKIGVNTMRNPSGEDMDIYLSVENVEVRIASEAPEETEDDLESSREAAENLQRYLSAAGQWNDVYVLEPLDPVTGKIGDTQVYRFEVRYRDTAGEVADRLVNNYAITSNYEAVYLYDPSNDVFVLQREEGQDIEPEPMEEAPEKAPEEAEPLASAFPIEFLFASGASSSGTTLTLNQDGSFSGQHFDHENVRGDGHPNGACYICDFSGQFEDIQQIDAHTYSMTLGEIVTEREEGEEWIEEGVLYIATKPFGLEDGKEFLFYTPGTPLDELSEDFLHWGTGRWSYQEDGEDSQTLPCYGLLNVATGEGFFQKE